jgi:hypothetical protein
MIVPCFLYTLFLSIYVYLFAINRKNRRVKKPACGQNFLHNEKIPYEERKRNDSLNINDQNEIQSVDE